MRWLLIIPFLLMASPAYAQENEAEKLFRAMEKKIQEAKAVKIVYELGGHVENLTVNAVKKYSLVGNGSAFFMDGNRVKLELETQISGQKYSASAVSDGNQFLSKISGNEERSKVTSSVKLRESLVAIIARSGCLSLLDVTSMLSKIEEMTTPQFEKKMSIRDFKLGKDENLAGAQPRIIEYFIMFEGKDVFQVKLWIDSVTLLPRKRQIANAKAGFNGSMLTETYTEFTLNPQLDPKLFELPK